MAPRCCTHALLRRKITSWGFPPGPWGVVRRSPRRQLCYHRYVPTKSPNGAVACIWSSAGHRPTAAEPCGWGPGSLQTPGERGAPLRTEVNAEELPSTGDGTRRLQSLKHFLVLIRLVATVTHTPEPCADVPDKPPRSHSAHLQPKGGNHLPASCLLRSRARPGRACSSEGPIFRRSSPSWGDTPGII